MGPRASVPLHRGLKFSFLQDGAAADHCSGLLGQRLTGGCNSEEVYSLPQALLALWPTDVTEREMGKEGLSKRQRISVSERGTWWDCVKRGC